MINKSIFSALRRRYVAYADERRNLIKIADDILSHSKRAIFAFHRDDIKDGEKHLLMAEKFFSKIAMKFKKTPELTREGSYRAAIEEYVEARFFLAFLKKQKIGKVDAPGINNDSLLGGVLDFTGEAVRYAVKSATEGNVKEVRRAYATVQDVAGELMQMNITGGRRGKYDQMKTNLRKLEEILYDLSLRGK